MFNYIFVCLKKLMMHKKKKERKEKKRITIICKWLPSCYFLTSFYFGCWAGLNNDFVILMVKLGKTKYLRKQLYKESYTHTKNLLHKNLFSRTTLIANANGGWIKPLVKCMYIYAWKLKQSEQFFCNCSPNLLFP